MPGGLKFILRPVQAFQNAAFLGNALPGKGELQVDGKPGEHRHTQHGEKPAVDIFPEEKGHQHGEHHTASAHHAQTHHAVDGGQQPALTAVPGGHRDHDAAGCAVNGGCKRVVQVVRHSDPHHARNAMKWHDEHEHAGRGKGKHRKQQPRPCLARRGAGALDQLPYQKVCRHDEHSGHQLQPAEEPQIQPEHIGKVALQDAAENTA